MTRLRAIGQRSRGADQRSKPSRSELIRNGTETKSIATTTPGSASLNLTIDERGSPINPCDPKTVRSAIPATVCGMMIGVSMMLSVIPLPGKSRLARNYASGMPNANAIAVAANAIYIVKRMI
uniref:Uncharacterized protein n=1 Tax=Candidatus Methanogaster sp. ANME-2c ERB4 TaxID=2759911 RepID=A0A7G9YNN2_9EURY|nr:hypothetical protein AIHMFPNM_00017 [Methanosarcinales archaeon ANME-2c ERB4]